MPTPPVLPLFDPTGANPANLVVDEIATVGVATSHMVAPVEGCYYTESLVVKNALTDAVLVLGTDYRLHAFDAELTARTGKEVACGIYVLPAAFPSGDVKLTYQSVGGYEGRNNVLLKELRDAILALGDTVDWANIVNKPLVFPPEPHLHSAITELTELEALRQAVTDLKDALIAKRPLNQSVQSMVDKLERMLYMIAELRIDMNAFPTIYATIAQVNVQVNNAISALVDGAPGALDTLNELAAALNDDANAFTTLYNYITEVARFGFDLPIPYAADTEFDVGDEMKTIDVAGIPYAGYADTYPFYTSGSWETNLQTWAKWKHPIGDATLSPGREQTTVGPTATTLSPAEVFTTHMWSMPIENFSIETTTIDYPETLLLSHFDSIDEREEEVSANINFWTELVNAAGNSTIDPPVFEPGVSPFAGGAGSVKFNTLATNLYYFQTSQFPNLNGLTEWTIEMFTKVNLADDQQGFLEIYDNSNFSNDPVLQFTNDRNQLSKEKWGFVLNSDGNNHDVLKNNSFGSYVIGQWNHIVIAFKQTSTTTGRGSYAMYVNGSRLLTRSNEDPITTDTLYARLGRANGRYANANFADLNVVDRAKYWSGGSFPVNIAVPTTPATILLGGSTSTTVATPYDAFRFSMGKTPIGITALPAVGNKVEFGVKEITGEGTPSERISRIYFEITNVAGNLNVAAGYRYDDEPAIALTPMVGSQSVIADLQLLRGDCFIYIERTSDDLANLCLAVGDGLAVTEIWRSVAFDVSSPGNTLERRVSYWTMSAFYFRCDQPGLVMDVFRGVIDPDTFPIDHSAYPEFETIERNGLGFDVHSFRLIETIHYADKDKFYPAGLDGKKVIIDNRGTTLSSNNMEGAVLEVNDKVDSILNDLTVSYVPKRQCVLNGPVDANGLPDFFDNTVTNIVSLKSSVATKPLILAFGDGFDKKGAVNYVVSFYGGTLGWWNGVVNNTYYFYFELNSATGAVTTGKSTKKPIYSKIRPSGLLVGDADTFWYPTDHRSRGEVWNGTAWEPTLRLYVGEGVRGANSSNPYSSLTEYAYQGKFYHKTPLAYAFDTNPNWEIPVYDNIGAGSDNKEANIKAEITGLVAPNDVYNGRIVDLGNSHSTWDYSGSPQTYFTLSHNENEVRYAKRAGDGGHFGFIINTIVFTPSCYVIFEVERSF